VSCQSSLHLDSCCGEEDEEEKYLHGRTVCVQADHIAATVASWLAELDAWSPFVELLGRAVRDGDWAAIHAIADYLSVEVQVAA
jgi:hypothetical protein